MKTFCIVAISSVLLIDVYGQNEKIQLTDANSNAIISSGGVAWITGDSPPKMPRLQAELKNAASVLIVRWTLSVTYDGETVEFKSPALKAWDKWNLSDQYPSSGFFGGDAVLVCAVNSKTKTHTFRILGKNPSDQACRKFIDSQSSAPWFAYAIAKHESKDQCGSGSRYNQFYDEKSARGNTPGFPVKSPDAGYGIMQLTDRPVARAQKWNWQENLKKGNAIIKGKITEANSWMQRQRDLAKGSSGRNVPVPDEKVGKVTFRDGSSKRIEDAVAIKGFNGSSKPTGASGSGYYCYWDTTNRRWGFQRFNVWRSNYVQWVCDEVE